MEWPKDVTGHHRKSWPHDGHTRETDAPLVAQTVRLEVVVIGPLYGWLASRPLLDSSGQPSKILNVLGLYENSLNRYYDRLGIGPDSRHRLDIRPQGG